MMERQANILDEIHDELDQNMFRGVDPRPNKIAFVRKHFYDGIKDVVPNPEQTLSLYLTGSLTTYQYSDNSDCDISVFPDYDALPQIMGLPDANTVRKALIDVVIKKLDGVIVPGTSHPVQHFVVLVDNKPEELYKPGVRSAWSFQTESWFVPPEKERVHNVRQELPAIYLRAHAIAEKMRVALDTDVGAAKRLFQRIHIKRTQDQRAGRGDFSEGNIVYKYLLHEGLFDRLRAIGLYIAKASNVVMIDSAHFSDPDDDHQDAPLLYDPKSDTLYVANSGGYHMDLIETLEDFYGIAAEHFIRAWFDSRTGELMGAQAIGPYHDRILQLYRQADPEDEDQYLPMHTAGSPDAGFEDWECPKCGAKGREQVYEDPEGGFECGHCGLAIVSKVAADHDVVQIIYDFNKDRIILGTKTQGAIPGTVIIGNYHDGEATMYEAAHQWMNTAYFKKLWIHSFPTWPLKGISFHGPKGHERVA